MLKDAQSGFSQCQGRQ